MGRSFIADEITEKYIEKLLKENQWYIGVIIGQLTSQRDYVVHLARTPDPVEDEVSEENLEDEPGDGPHVTHRTPTVTRPASLDQLDEKWVSTHAKQVSRMLPGGLNVIGLFAIAPPSMLKNSQAKLRQTLFAVHKTLNKNSALSVSGEITDRVLLQIDTSSKKLTCVTLDVSDNKSANRPAEWKYQSGGGNKWVKLTSHIRLDIPMAIPVETNAQSMLKQIQSGLTVLCSNVRQSIVTLGGALREPSESLVTGSDKKSGKAAKGDKTIPNTKPAYDVNIYMPLVNHGCQDPKTMNSQATINIVGKAAIRAYVSVKASVNDAIEAIKMDVIRSLLARCELLCEEFDVTGEKQGSEMYDPPVRLFSSLPNSEVQICDYVFQDEKKEEVRQRIKELLDIDVDDLEEAEKSAADDDTWSCQSSLSGMSSQQSLASPQAQESGSIKVYVGAAVGGVAAVLAAWMSYAFLGDE